MTSIEILEDILKQYSSRMKTQEDIAKQYHVEQTYISNILQECGFHISKFTGEKSVDINIIWQNEEVRRLCEELAQINQ